MAESAVLRRSFSNPSEISFQEGDPLRALGESISFGRYMSESLAWEKWSTFSHNRYLEEAEKYSKPGSVAKMKAHFEAHYKSIGARKQAAEEQANDVARSVEPEVQDDVKDTSSLNLDEAEANSHSKVHDFPAKDTPDVEPLSNLGVRSSGPFTEIKEPENEEILVLETGTTIDVAEGLVVAQLQQRKDPEVKINVNKSDYEIKENKYSVAPESDTVVSSPKRKTTFQEMEKENLDSKSKQKSAIACLKKSAKGNVSKLSSSLARLGTRTPKKPSIETPKSRISTKEPVDVKKPAPKLFHISTNSDSKLASSLARLATPIPKKDSIETPKSRKPTKDPLDVKKPAPKLLDMSTDFDSKLTSPLARLATHIAKKDSIETPKSRKSMKEPEPLDVKKPAPKLLHITNYDSKFASSLARVASPVYKKESKGTPKNRKSTEAPPEEKKPALKLLRISINPDANPIKKTSEALHKTRMGKLFTPLGKIIRESFDSSTAPSRASVSRSVSRHTSATPSTETRRSRIALAKSFDKTRKMEQKLQSPCVGNMKSSVQSPAPTIFSSFSFRTEERAVKRREFFQKKLEREAEKMQLLDKAKELKAKPHFRKSCVNLEANLSQDIKSGVLNDNTKKIPSRQTESPKRKSKTAADLAPGACSRPPKRNINFIPTQSSIPLTMKKKQENASPNIL